MRITDSERRIIWLVGIVVVLILVASFAFGQEVVVVAEPLPDEITTWSGLVAYWLPKVIQGILAIVGTALALALRQVVALAPTFVQAYIDNKRQKDFTAAIMTKVAQFMKEGRWPSTADLTSTGRELVDVLKPDLVEEIRQYVNEYSPQAGRWAGVEIWSDRADKLLRAQAVKQAAILKPEPEWRGPVIPTR